MATELSGPARVQLRTTFTTRFSLEELKTLCDYLEIDYDSLEGEGKGGKARALVGHLERRDRLGELPGAVATAFPDIQIDWPPELLLLVPPADAPVAPARPQPPVSASVKLKHPEVQTVTAILAGRPDFLTPDGRKTILDLAGVSDILNVNLNGNPLPVAGAIVVQLNNYGPTTDGEYAIGRLLVYLTTMDNTVNQAERQKLEQLIAQYGL